MHNDFRLAVLSGLACILAACGDPAPDDAIPQSFAALSYADSITLIDERADVHNVRAASVTVIDGATMVTHFIGEANEQALFQAASMSKAVAAAGILTLMEREDIDIDADIRDRFTSIDIRSIPGGDQPLTVRELLSHTAGATQGGFPGYRRGRARPTSAEIILDPPSRFVSPVTLSLPKGAFSYSGGGYQIAQLLAEDISGQPFTTLMHELLLGPLDMNASTFSQPINPDTITPLRIIGADSGRRIREGLFNPLKDSWHDYPEQAAAGLWTTSADYAHFIDALLDAAAGRPSPISPSIATAMLTPVAEIGFGAPGDQYGLGLMLRLDSEGDLDRLSHSGLNAGYRSLFTARPGQDRIVVSLTNTPGGAAFNTEIVEGLLLTP